MHNQSSGWATYQAVAGVTTPANTGPRAPDAVNQWPAILSGSMPGPRREVIHMIHSPKYYPGNCSFKTCWRTRNCPVAIRVGDLKLMVGFVGDARLVPTPAASAKAVAWGQSDGACNPDFPERCTSPGWGAAPCPANETAQHCAPRWPTPEGLCVQGCLFNLSNDRSESRNLFGAPELATQQAAMAARLEEAGKTLAAPWAVVPELVKLTPEAVEAKLCAAARHLKNVAPIDLCGASGCPPRASY
eukprot:SAG22_NODE_72_length_22344_cov_95.586559_6_plen_245_part_00